MRANKTISKLLGISSKTLAKIVENWTEKCNGETLSDNDTAALLPIPQNQGSYNIHRWRVDDKRANYVKIQDFVRQERIEKRRVTVAQIMNNLLSKNIITLGTHPEAFSIEKDRLV